MKKIILASALGAVFVLSSCGGSGDDVAQLVAQEFYVISGQVTNGSSPEADVTVKGIYSDGSPLNPSTTTLDDGTFSIEVLKNTPVSAQVSKSGFATLNSAKEALNANESGFDVELVTTVDAEAVIAEVFPGPTLAGNAWLVAKVVDNTDEEVSGITISTTGSPVDTAATDCNGNDSSGDVTIAPCPSRDGPMYLAYFDTDSIEVTVTAGSDSQLAPVRRGEVTFLEFEVVPVPPTPVGTFEVGRDKYDAGCDICHAAGTHDPDLEVTKAGDLYDKGELLITDLSSLGGMPGITITQQELLDLTAFLESVTIKP
jgi:hypothetical protein